MAKSTIIKELANSSIDTATALKRLKVLLSNFDRPELMSWVNNELTGYNDTNEVPPYRKSTGQLKGSFIIGNSSQMMKYTNTPLPLVGLSEEARAAVEDVNFVEGITAIRDMIGQSINKPIPPETYGYIKRGTNITSILSARVDIRQSAPQEIISAVENRVLDTLFLLEKEFGNLDDLDIDCTSKSKEELDAVSQKIINIIFWDDNSITIGDHNKISKSEISTQS